MMKNIFHKMALFIFFVPITGHAIVNEIIIKATVVATPCTINDGNPIDIDFGNNLQSSKINGNNYMQEIQYTINCSNASSSALKLMISGVSADFDSEILASSTSDLGIELLTEKETFPLNTWYNFDGDTPPQIYSVPKKKPDSSIPPGEFTATATMSIDYQ